MKTNVSGTVNDTANFVITTDAATLDNFLNHFGVITNGDIGEKIELISSK